MSAIGDTIDGHRYISRPIPPELSSDGEHSPAPAARLERTAGARPRVALAHDWLVGYRGGEAVLDAIVRMCGGRYELASLYVMFDDGRGVTPAIDRVPKAVSHLNLYHRSLRRWLLPWYPRAAGELERRLARDHAAHPVQLLISTSSAAVKGMATPRGVPHVCYCHTPARYLWSQTAEYGGGGPLGWARRLGLWLDGPTLRRWDRQTAAHVDVFVANSTHTQREIERCYGRSSTVVHPPVRTEYFTPSAANSPNTSAARSGWLYVGALEPYKRVDLAIDAAKRAAESLTIVGTGSQEKSLRARAGDAVTFTGHVGDAELREHFRRARVLIFPQIEDFGIVAVEAQACGLPVAARRAGGALDTVIDGKTGVLFDEATPEAVAHAAERCAGLGDVSRVCRVNAERFGEARFEREMLAVIQRALRGEFTA